MNYGISLFLLAARSQNSEWMKYAMWWAMPLMYIGLIAMIYTLYRFVKMFGDAKMCRVNMAESSEVEIKDVGEFDLILEAPAMTFMAGRGLQYELIRASDGKAVELRSTASMLMGRKAVTTISFPVRAFEIEEIGKYQLKVSGFQPQTIYSGYSLRIERPTTLKTFLYIPALILTIAMFVVGLIFTVIAHKGNG